MGVKGVVTSLYDIKAGETWTYNKIKSISDNIKSYGLKWNVVESLPVAEGIKTHSKDYERLIENYIILCLFWIGQEPI